MIKKSTVVEKEEKPSDKDPSKIEESKDNTKKMILRKMIIKRMNQQLKIINQKIQKRNRNLKNQPK